VLLCQLKPEEQHHYSQHLSLYLDEPTAFSSTSSCPFYHFLLAPSMQENGLEYETVQDRGLEEAANMF
jgi:hypothetical protein